MEDTIEKLANKRTLASRAVAIGDYSSGKRLYENILEMEPNDIEAMFFVVYCSILAKKKKDYKVDCSVFYKNMKLVFENLKQETISPEDKKEQGTMFVKYTKEFCDALLSQAEEEYDKAEEKNSEKDDYDSTAWYEYGDNKREIYKVMASVCAFAVDAQLDLQDCRHEVLDMATQSLDFYGKDSKSYICDVLRQIRSMLLDAMEERGDDVAKEREADKKHEEVLYNEAVEEKVKQKISDMISGR